jgi:hypothetical protein
MTKVLGAMQKREMQPIGTRDLDSGSKGARGRPVKRNYLMNGRFSAPELMRRPGPSSGDSSLFSPVFTTGAKKTTTKTV